MKIEELYNLYYEIYYYLRYYMLYFIEKWVSIFKNNSIF